MTTPKTPARLDADRTAQLYVGKWFTETDKGVRLYCEAVDEHGPRMSYRPGDPIAVCPQWADFAIYFKETP